MGQCVTRTNECFPLPNRCPSVSALYKRDRFLCGLLCSKSGRVKRDVLQHLQYYSPCRCVVGPTTCGSVRGQFFTSSWLRVFVCVSAPEASWASDAATADVAAPEKVEPVGEPTPAVDAVFPGDAVTSVVETLKRFPMVGQQGAALLQMAQQSLGINLSNMEMGKIIPMLADLQKNVHAHYSECLFAAKFGQGEFPVFSLLGPMNFLARTDFGRNGYAMCSDNQRQGRNLEAIFSHAARPEQDVEEQSSQVP